MAPGNISDNTGAVWELRATFANSDQMQDAVNRLGVSGFDRADLSLPSHGLIEGSQTPEEGTKPANTEEDARQARTLGASTAASIAAIAAAGVTIATGGAAAPAVAVAIAAGGAAGGSVFAVSGAANNAEQRDRNQRAAHGDLVLAVRTDSEEKRTHAEAILREAGASTVEAVS